jgi:hypothetical protein
MVLFKNLKDKTEYLQTLIDTIDLFITQWEQENEKIPTTA